MHALSSLIRYFDLHQERLRKPSEYLEFKAVPIESIADPKEGYGARVKAYLEELVFGDTPVHQSYDPPTQKAIDASLTDAELFDSYGLPDKAIQALETVLSIAPLDITMNKRLAVLYAQGSRYRDAADRFDVLGRVYRELGHKAEEARYLKAALKYARLAQSPPSAARPLGSSTPLTQDVTEFAFEVDYLKELAGEAPTSPPQTSPAAAPTAPVSPPAVAAPSVTEAKPGLKSATPEPALTVEELGSEWEDAVFSLETPPEKAPSKVPSRTFLNFGHRLARSTLGQWTALFAGVLIQPFFRNYQTSGHWVWDGLGGWTLFSLITSVLIFPAVYKSAFDPSKPVIVQLAPIFAGGIGWQSLLATAIKAGGQVVH
jgi:hypothetical protein